MSSPGGPDPHLRVGNAERDAVTTILQDAAVDGRLDMDELDERVGAALRARTYGDLDALVADLSVELPWQRRSPAPLAGPPPVGSSREDPLRLDGGMSSEKREGRWLVPPFVRISPGVGSVKLNCLQATVAARVIEVEVVAGAGSVLIIVPDGWGADADRLSKTMGSKTVRVPRSPAPGQPLLVFTGTVGLGSFKVRPGSRRELRRAGLDPDRS